MKNLSLVFILILTLSSYSFTIEKKSSKKDYISNSKCLISGDSIDKTEFLNYKDGKIYFCCEMCKADFQNGKSNQFSSKANYQLVSTGQYIQKSCPMTGKGIDKTKTVSVGELNVAFCCNGCKSKTEGKKDKAEFIFANDVFDKTFFSAKSKVKSYKK
tara:strand:- start:312 stop:785 length:474 start_codon:yes stop_codon:yes gene_type:complete